MKDFHTLAPLHRPKLEKIICRRDGYCLGPRSDYRRRAHAQRDADRRGPYVPRYSRHRAENIQVSLSNAS